VISRQWMLGMRLLPKLAMRRHRNQMVRIRLLRGLEFNQSNAVADQRVSGVPPYW
jgi:hypothetical protein